MIDLKKVIKASISADVMNADMIENYVDKRIGEAAYEGERSVTLCMDDFVKTKACTNKDEYKKITYFVKDLYKLHGFTVSLDDGYGFRKPEEMKIIISWP